jgi:hypothetical protein
MSRATRPDNNGCAHRPAVRQAICHQSFEAAEAEAYRRDVPDAEAHFLYAGRFALDEQPDRIAELTRQFLHTSLPG